MCPAAGAGSRVASTAAEVQGGRPLSQQHLLQGLPEELLEGHCSPALHPGPAPGPPWCGSGCQWPPLSPAQLLCTTLYCTAQCTSLHHNALHTALTCTTVYDPLYTAPHLPPPTDRREILTECPDIQLSTHYCSLSIAVVQSASLCYSNVVSD